MTTDIVTLLKIQKLAHEIKRLQRSANTLDQFFSFIILLN